MYGITRSGEKITADKVDIPSDCQQIVFLNQGDTPCSVTIRDTQITFDLAAKTDTKTDYLIFGSINNPCHMEESIFNVAFGALVTTRNLTVMRIYIKEK